MRWLQLTFLSPGTGTEYFLSVSTSLASPKQRRQVETTYITPTGGITGDCGQAAKFTFAKGGQLMTGQDYVSTTGLFAFQPFKGAASVATISSVFSIQNGTLVWNNAAFTGGRTLFCLLGSTVEAVFNGQLPYGCTQIDLQPIMITPNICLAAFSSSSLPTSTQSASTMPVPGSVHSGTNAADPVGSYTSSNGATILDGPSEMLASLSLEACESFCAGYIYFGVSNGMLVTGCS